MSHIISGKTKVKDPVILNAACKTLGLKEPVDGKHKVYSGTYEGMKVELKGWNYPVIFLKDTAESGTDLTGETKYDNYGGRWGSEDRYNELTQRYTLEAEIAAAKANGYGYQEITQDDGEVRLEVLVEA